MESNQECLCKGCDHKIPWDWVFCAWCGFENDRPGDTPTPPTPEGVPHYAFLWMRPVDSQPWPIIYKNKALAESSKFRVGPVVDVLLKVTK